MKLNNIFFVSILSFPYLPLTALAEGLGDTFANPSADGSFNIANDVVLIDSVWTNPANIVDMSNQVSISSESAGGIVLPAFGQKFGFHVAEVDSRSDIADARADMFWGSTFGFGEMGLRLGLEVNSEKDLKENDFPLGTIDSGNNTFNVDYDTNETVSKFSDFILMPGFTILKGRIEIVGEIAYTTARFGDAVDKVEVTTFGAAAGGNPTGSETIETDNEEMFRASRFSFGTNTRFYFEENLYVNFLGKLVNTSRETTVRDSERITNRNGDGDIISDTANIDESLIDISNRELSLGIELGVIEKINKSVVRLEAGLVGIWNSSDIKEKVLTDQFVDHTINSNSIRNATGLNFEEEDSGFRFNLPVRATFQANVTDQWSWRAGIQTNLVEIFSESKVKVDYSPKSDNTGFDKDFTSQMIDSSSLAITNGTSVAFGFGYEPIENLTLDLVFNQEFLTGDNGFMGEPIASRFTLSYRY